MSNTIGTAQINLSLDSSGVEAGVKASKKSIESLKDAAVKTGKEASAGLGAMGESTDKLDAATKRAQRSIELQTLAIGKSRSEFLAAKAAIDGNSAALAPYIARLAEAERAAQKTGSSLSGLKSMAIGALGAIGVSLSVSAFTGMIEGAAKAQAGLQQLAERTNSTVESLSGLKSVAKLSGTDMEQVATAIQKMSRNMADASPAAMNAFKAIGVSSKEMAQGMRDPATMLLTVAKHLDEFGDGAGKTAVLMEIFGKAGANLGPMLKDLATQGGLNAKVTAEQAKAADELEKNLIRLKGGANALYNDIAKFLVPKLADITDGMVEVRKESGLLAAAFYGIGGAIVAAFGGETNELKRAESEAADVFKRLAQAKSTLVGREKDYANGGILGKFLIDRSKSEVDELKAQLKGLIETKNKLLTAAGEKNAIDTAPKKELKDPDDGKKLPSDTSAYDAAIKKSQDFIAQLQKQAAAVGATAYQQKLYDAEQIASTLKAAGVKEAAVLKFLQSAEREAFALQESTRLEKEKTEAAKFQAEGLKRLAQEEANRVKSLSESVENDQKALDAMTRKNDLLERGIESVTAMAVAELEAKRASMDYADATVEEVNALEKRLDIAKQIEAQAKRGEGIKAMKDEAEAAAKAWEKSTEEINRSLTDALMRGFESGKDFASSFKDSVVNMFKTMVLRPVVSAIVQPAAGAVTGALGSLGLPGMAQAAGTSALGSAGGSLLGNAGSAIGSAVFGNSTAYGLGVSGLSLGGEQAAMLAAQTAEFGAAGLSATAGAAGGGGLMATIGTALPWIGGALLVASLLDKHGGPKTGGYSGDFAERFYTPTESDGQAKTLIDGLRAQIGASLGAFGKSSSGIKLGVGFDTDPQGTAADRISSRVTVGGKTVLDSGKEFGRGTLEQNLPGEIERMFLAAMKEADVHPVVNALLDGMAIDTAGADQLKVMAEAVASASSLLGDSWQRAFGPLKTAAEDLQAKWADVAGAGQPSLLALKDLVLGLDLTTEAGRASAQSLLGLTTAIQAQETAALALIGKTRESIAQDLYQALANSPDAASAGEMFASSVVGGIQNALVNTYTQQISDLMTSGIITPAIDALLTGASVSEALSQANMDAILKQARAYSDAFSAIWGNEDFQAALGQIKTSIKGVVGAVAPTLQPAIHAARPVAPVVVVEPVAKPDDTASKTADLSRQRRALEISLMEAEGHALEALAAKRADELAALDDSLKPLQQRLYDLQDAADAANKAADAQKALNAAQEAALAAADKLRQSLISVANDAVSQQFNALQRAVDAEKESATEAYNAAVEKSKTGIDKLATSVDKFKRLADSLKSALDKMTPPNASPALQRQEAQAQIEAALAIAQAGGPLPDQDAIARALDTVSQNNSDLFATALDANRDFYRAFNSVSKLSDLTGKQLTVEDKALQAAQTANDLLKKTYEAEISRLDGVLDSARAQIDALNGINTSVVSVATAIANLAAALQVAALVKQNVAGDRIEGGKYISSGGAVYNGATGSITTPSGAEFSAVAAQQFVSGVVDSVTAGGLSAAAGVTAIYDAAVASGISAQSLDGLMGWTPGTSNAVASEYGLKKFAVGTNYIPEDMPAIVHRGERIIPAADNAALMERLASPAQSNAALVNEVRALRAELAQLRAEQRAANGAIAQNTMDSAKLSRKWDADGIPETRTL